MKSECPLLSYRVAIFAFVALVALGFAFSSLSALTPVARAADSVCDPGGSAAKSTGSPAAAAPCDVIISAVVDTSLSIFVEPDAVAQDPDEPTSQVVDGRIVLFPPVGDDTAHVVAGHELTVYTAGSATANVSLNMHAAGMSATGAMVCVAFCYAPGDPNPSGTYTNIAPADDDCTANIGGDCTLLPNTWGFIVPAHGHGVYDYQSVPKGAETPYPIINSGALAEDMTEITEQVSFAVSTDQTTRPGLYAATVMYTLTPGVG